MKGPSVSCNFVQRDATRHQTQQAFFPSRPEYCTAKEKKMHPRLRLEEGLLVQSHSAQMKHHSLGIAANLYYLIH